ncbi:MAG: hypothetical protein COA64_00100 [Henriciella sp.]|nr:MAG: hypothetical protein COA64_00100 [Henriciella sp.]
MTALALRYWKPLAGAGIALLLVIGFNIWLSSTKSAAYERGFEKAASECATAREAAQKAREDQIEDIRKEEAEKRAELEARQAVERAENEALDRKVTEANQRAERARRDAERRIDEALSIDGYAGCTSTDRVSDGLRGDLSAYRTRHGN